MALSNPFVPVNRTLSFSEILIHSARAHPQRVAVVHAGKEITYEAFNLRVNRLANGLLSVGLRPGDSVAAYMPSCLEMIEAYWATAKAGMTLIPLNAMLQTTEIARIFELANVRCVLVDESMVHLLPPAGSRIDLVISAEKSRSTYESLMGVCAEAEPEVNVDPESACTVMFSSGTTSRPKGIVNSHRARAAACHIYAAEFGLTFRSRTLLATPLYHNSFLILALPTMAMGGCVVLESKFDPIAIKKVWQERSITHALLVPTQLRRLLSDEQDVQPLSASTCCLVSVGEPLPELVSAKVLQQLTPHLFTMYGISEGLATVLRPEMQSTHAGTVGTPVLYTDIRIVDDAGQPVSVGAIGEVIGRSARMMSGYLKDDVATAAALRDGWLYTGDLGLLSEDGVLRIVGRKKEMIISGGVNIFPIDIERVVASHPAVQEAVALGVPDDQWGEIVKLVVVPKPDSGLTSEALTEWCRSRLPGYQRPKTVEFRSELPRNATGKVIKQLLALPEQP